MSNEIKTGNLNDQSGTGKSNPSRANEAPKGGQQSQGTTPQNQKAPSQPGGSDHKSGQQSQGGSRADDDGMKQAGSTKPADVNQKSGSPK